MPGHDKDEFKNEAWINTYPSQSQFHLIGGGVDEISLDDMIHATARQCRFMGHLPCDLYSVLEHQIHTAKVVEWLLGYMNRFSKENLLAIRQALFHDMTEAYLVDMAAPWKDQLPNYRELEASVWSRIATKFDMPEKLSPLVKKADWIMLFAEALHFNLPRLESWVGWAEYGKLAQRCPAKIKAWGPAESEAVFRGELQYLDWELLNVGS